MSPCLYLEEEDNSKFLKTLIIGEGIHSNVRSNHTLVYYDFPGNLPKVPFPPSTIFLLFFPEDGI